MEVVNSGVVRRCLVAMFVLSAVTGKLIYTRKKKSYGMIFDIDRWQFSPQPS